MDIIGNRSAVAALERELREGHLPHAVLLVGPAGVGKTRLALRLAQALNCTGDEIPCGVCLHCRQTDAGSHPDVAIVERREAKDSILIEQVRELREAASLRPFQGRRKIYIIAGAEGMTAQAADALLKTLEEPEEAVTLILTAVDADALPATIVSRCRVVLLAPPGTTEIATALAGNGLEQEAAERIARLSRGNVGWALEAARQPKLVKQQEELVERLSRLPQMTLEERLVLVEQITGERKDRSSIRRYLEVLILLARDLLLLGQDLPPVLMNEGTQARDQARRYGLRGAEIYLEAVRRAMERIDQNVDPRLTLEALMMSLP